MASENWLNQDFYKVLGVAEDASEADIKKAYRKMARKYHPDQHPGDTTAEKKFKEISEAYDVLSDKKDREEYDQIRKYGAAGFAGAQGGGYPGGYSSSGFSGYPGGFGGAQTGGFSQSGGQNINIEDLLGGMFGGGGSGFGGFGGQSGFQQTPRKGADVEANARISFKDSFNGTTRQVTLPNGKTTKVKIPTGVKDGQKLKLRGKGQEGPGGAGDLIVHVFVDSHPVFEREGNDVLVHVPVSLEEAVEGAVLEVPTPDNKSVKLRLAASAPAGRKMRAKGRGFKTSKAIGNLIVIPEVQLPADLSAEAQEVFEKFVALAPQSNVRDELIRKAAQ